MLSVCTVLARGGRSCERFGGYKTRNRNTFTFLSVISSQCSMPVLAYLTNKV